MATDPKAQVKEKQPSDGFDTVRGLELVRLRNHFYRDGYRNTMLALLGSILVNILLIVIVGFQYYLKPAPVYFATQTDGTLIEIQPLYEPLVDEEMLLMWSSRAAIAAFSYNFLDYQDDLQQMRQYFTPAGFDNYLDALQQSGNLDTVLTKRLVVKGVVTQVPVIVQHGLIKGRYAWKIEIPMLISYVSANETLEQPILVTMLISRVSTQDKPQGIAIAQFVVEDRK
jgi:intracellular multiplication protein IcmL